MEGAAQPVSEPAVKFEVDLGAGRGLAFEPLAHDRNGGTAASELALPLAEQVGTAQVAGNLGQHVLKPARPCGVPRMRYGIFRTIE